MGWACRLRAGAFGHFAMSVMRCVRPAPIDLAASTAQAWQHDVDPAGRRLVAPPAHAHSGGTSGAHLLNDLIQALIPAIYPIIKDSYRLDFVQIGLITLTFQIAGSLLQPVVGWHTDTHPCRTRRSPG